MASENELVKRGVRHNTLSLEYELFWNLEFWNLEFPSRTINYSLDLASRSDYTRWNWQRLNWTVNQILARASSDGCMEILKLMLLRGAREYNWGLLNASCKGHREIVELFLELGATDFEDALLAANENGHFEIAQLIMKAGVTKFKSEIPPAIKTDPQLVLEFLVTRWVDDIRMTDKIDSIMSYIIWEPRLISYLTSLLE